MRVEEETQPWREAVHRQAAFDSPFNVFNSVAQRERQFLYRSRSRFANVIAADRNRVEAGHMLCSVLDHIGHQAHGWPRRINVLLLRNVFLQYVVLEGAG